MTEGSATPRVVSAILTGMPGKYGISARAAPPSATQPPPRTPRANRLGVPRVSRRCEYHPAAIIATALAPAGSAPNNPIEPCARPSPLIRNAPCQASACDSPQLAPKLAHQLARIVGLNNNCR